MGADLLSPVLQQIVDGALKRYRGSPAGLCGQPLVIADVYGENVGWSTRK